MIKLGKQQISTLFFLFVVVFGLVMSKFAPPEKTSIVVSSQTSSTATVVDSEGALIAIASSTLPVVHWPSMVSSTAVVTRVIDGDTVDVLFDDEKKAVRLRLLGINTPESVDPRRPVQCFGKEASKHMKDLVENKRVAVLSDVQADDRDKYGRLLRALVLEDQTDVNGVMVAQGYAHAYLDFPLNKNRKAQLRRLEAEAKENGYGLWNIQTCAGEAYK